MANISNSQADQQHKDQQSTKITKTNHIQIHPKSKQPRNMD